MTIITHTIDNKLLLKNLEVREKQLFSFMKTQLAIPVSG